MKEELDALLCKTYPKIFVNRYKDMKETCMCWGFECGDGWYNIINTLCSNIQNHVDWSHKQYKFDTDYNSMVADMQSGNFKSFDDYATNVSDAFKETRRLEILENGFREVKQPCPQVVAEQVKEKFGSLRFYYQGGDDYISGMTSFAESLSAIICEGCGVPSKITNTIGWINNLCTACTNQREIEREEYMKKNGFEG
jgi:hypothetical protein